MRQKRVLEPLVGYARNNARITALVRFYLVFVIAAVYEIKPVRVSVRLACGVRTQRKKGIAVVSPCAFARTLSHRTVVQRRTRYNAALILICAEQLDRIEVVRFRVQTKRRNFQQTHLALALVDDLRIAHDSVAVGIHDVM